jgi:hypothetical protein
LSRFAIALASVLTAHLTVTSSADAQLVPAGPDDVIPYPDPSMATVARSSSGEIMLAWTYLTSFSSHQVLGRRFDAEGLAIGSELDLSGVRASGSVGSPALAINAAGDMIVAWRENTGAGNGQVYARRLDAAGTPISPIVQVISTGARSPIDVSIDAAGRSVVTWGYLQSPDRHVFFQRLDASGALVGSAVQVDATSNVATAPFVQHDAAGNFVVAWTHAAASAERAMARRYDSSGASLDAGFEVDSSTSGQTVVGLSVSPDGSFSVAWGYKGPSAQLFEYVFVREFDSAGQPDPLYPSFSLSLGGEQLSEIWDVRRTPDGTYVALFEDERDVTSLAEFSVPANGGQLLGERFPGARLRPLDGRVAAMDLDGEGNPAVAITSYESDWMSLRRFCRDGSAGCDLCGGFDDNVDADGDGVPDGCDRCTTNASPVSARAQLRAPSTSPGNAFRTMAGFSALLALPVPFSALDLAATGARVFLTSQLGDDVFDSGLLLVPEAGSGWKKNAAGTSWTFAQRAADGSRSVKLKLRDVSSQGPGLASLSFVAKQFPMRVYANDVPPLESRSLAATLVLGGDVQGQAGECGEQSFGPASCTLAESRDERVRIRCNTSDF